MGDLSFCASLLRNARETQRWDDVRQILGKAVDRAGPGLSRWRYDELIKKLAAGNGPARPLLARIKYGDRLTRGTDPLAVADAISEGMRLPPPLLDFLFERRRERSWTMKAWAPLVRRAFAIDHAFQDLKSMKQPTHLDAVLDQQAWEDVKTRIRAADGLVCVIFHSGLLSIVRDLYESLDEGLSFQAAKSRDDQRFISAGGDPRAALFTALRALGAGRHILIAPDGPLVSTGVQINVLGTRTMIGEGAVFLAYEAAVATAWLSVSLADGRLRPTLLEGPLKERGESYDSFKARWIRFFETHVEAALTGHPADLALRIRWTRPLAEISGLRMPP